MLFRSPHICLCLSEETVIPGGPFYLVCIPEEVKHPTWGKCVPCSGHTNKLSLDFKCPANDPVQYLREEKRRRRKSCKIIDCYIAVISLETNTY